jgi:predicted nucleic acid binding AN1-type Zn finger protein
MSLHSPLNSPLILPKDLIGSLSTMTLSEPAVVAPPKKCCSAEGCKKRLTLTDTVCRCGVRFCGLHRLPETHACSFDYKAIGQKALKNQLVKCDGDRLMDRI